MQNNINVGSENASKITDTHGGSGVVGKVMTFDVVPVFAVLVVPKYKQIDLIKALAVNDSQYWPVMQMATGNGISLELVVRGGFDAARVEVFGFSSTGPAGAPMSLRMLGAHIEELTEAADFVNHLPDNDIILQSALNDVLRHDYNHNAIACYQDERFSVAIADSLRGVNSRIIQLYDGFQAKDTDFWDIRKLMVISNGACVHIDQLKTVGAMTNAWLCAVHSHNGEHIPFRRVIDERDNPIYTFDYDGCKTWFDVVETVNKDEGMSVAELRSIRNEVLIQNFWYLTEAAMGNYLDRCLAKRVGNDGGAVFMPQEHLDALAKLPFLRDSIPRSNHRIWGVCITHPNGQTEYHQIRRKGIYTDSSFSIITPSNLSNLLLACPSASLRVMAANGLEFGHSTVSVFTI